MSSSTSTSSKSARIVEGSCWTCRKRRLKCDLGRPTCAKCRASASSCNYGSKELQWVGGAAIRGRLKSMSSSSSSAGAGAGAKTTVVAAAAAAAAAAAGTAKAASPGANTSSSPSPSAPMAEASPTASTVSVISSTSIPTSAPGSVSASTTPPADSSPLWSDSPSPTPSTATTAAGSQMVAITPRRRQRLAAAGAITAATGGRPTIPVSPSTPATLDAGSLVQYFSNLVFPRFQLSDSLIPVDEVRIMHEPALREAVLAVSQAHHQLKLASGPVAGTEAGGVDIGMRLDMGNRVSTSTSSSSALWPSPPPSTSSTSSPPPAAIPQLSSSSSPPPPPSTSTSTSLSTTSSSSRGQSRQLALETFRQRIAGGARTAAEAQQLFQIVVIFCMLDGMISPGDEGSASLQHLRGGVAMLANWPSLPSKMLRAGDMQAHLLSVFATMDLVHALLSGDAPFFEPTAWPVFAGVRAWWGRLDPGDRFLDLLKVYSELAFLGNAARERWRQQQQHQHQQHPRDLFAENSGDTMISEKCLVPVLATLDADVFSTSSTPTPDFATPDQWRSFCSIYEAGAAIYIYRVLRGRPIDDEDVQRIARAAVVRLVERPLPGMLAHCSIFPLLVLGAHCIGKQDQRTVADSIKPSVSFLGFGYLVMVLRFLDAVWAQPDPARLTTWWDIFEPLSDRSFPF